jgi:hypothetical protein
MSSADVYFSCDIEADGPIPGPYSMVSFGLSVAGTYDGQTFEPHHPFARTFYAELKPISDEYVPEALAVSGLDRERLMREGQDPAVAMSAAAEWVREVAGAMKGSCRFRRLPAGLRLDVHVLVFRSFRRGWFAVRALPVPRHEDVLRGAGEDTDPPVHEGADAASAAVEAAAHPQRTWTMPSSRPSCCRT